MCSTWSSGSTWWSFSWHLLRFVSGLNNWRPKWSIKHFSLFSSLLQSFAWRIIFTMSIRLLWFRGKDSKWASSMNSVKLLTWQCYTLLSKKYYQIILLCLLHFSYWWQLVTIPLLFRARVELICSTFTNTLKTFSFCW